MICGLMRMWRHDLLRCMPSIHNNLWSNENVSVTRSFLYETSFGKYNCTTLHHTKYITLEPQLQLQLHYITPHYANCITWHYITLHYTTLHYTTLHYTTPHYATLNKLQRHLQLHYLTLHWWYSYASTTLATLQLQLHYNNFITPHHNYNCGYTTTTTPLHYNYSCTSPHYIQQLWVRWPLQPLQTLQKTQLQPPFGPVDSLGHPWFTTNNLSYSVLSLKLPPPPCVVPVVYTCKDIQHLDNYEETWETNPLLLWLCCLWRASCEQGTLFGWLWGTQNGTKATSSIGAPQNFDCIGKIVEFFIVLGLSLRVAWDILDSSRSTIHCAKMSIWQHPCHSHRSHLESIKDLMEKCMHQTLGSSGCLRASLAWNCSLSGGFCKKERIDIQLRLAYWICLLIYACCLAGPQELPSLQVLMCKVLRVVLFSTLVSLHVFSVLLNLGTDFTSEEVPLTTKTRSGKSSGYAPPYMFAKLLKAGNYRNLFKKLCR